ncbi:MAG: phosphoribosylglycinamide formyltransferase [Xanthomonadales bacterium]|nr:phosphoribosylglycinamide formyltransferase [Xanthomonadales bacterium]
MNIVVFISGRGSNLKALLKDQNGYQVTHVISDKRGIKGFDVAKQFGIPHSYINWKERPKAEAIATEILTEEQPDLIVLAGFMKVLSANFVEKFHHQIINIHPSLLPDYPGLNTHQRVLNDRKTEHGASVHFVDNQLDHGQIISQTRIAVETHDTAESLATKLILKEHKLLVQTVGQIANKYLFWRDNTLFYIDKPLQKPLVY